MVVCVSENLENVVSQKNVLKENLSETKVTTILNRMFHEKAEKEMYVIYRP